MLTKVDTFGVGRRVSASIKLKTECLRFDGVPRISMKRVKSLTGACIFLSSWLPFKTSGTLKVYGVNSWF